MQFLAIALVGLIAVFAGGFVVSSISSAIDDFSTISVRSESGTSFSERIRGLRRSQQAGGTILGASTAVANPLPYDGDIISALAAVPDASRFKELFKEASGASFVEAGALYTLFVPTDSAFAALSSPTKAELNTMNASELTRFATYHLVPQKMVAVGWSIKAGTVPAVSGDLLNFELRDAGGTVGNARVVATYLAGNGIVYVIDGVLLPPERRAEFR